jgi:hypothetical protein
MMMTLIKKIKKYFTPKPRFFFIKDGKYKISEAFRANGKSYYMFDNLFEMPSHRGFSALTYYDELTMRCSRDYLLKHCRAIEILLGDQKKFDIGTIALIHRNLQDRVKLLPIPEHIYKLASVLFFDKTESPFAYDHEYNVKKIEEWKHTEGLLDFFLKTELKNLVPSLRSQESDILIFSKVAEQIDKMHQKDISEVLSRQP